MKKGENAYAMKRSILLHGEDFDCENFDYPEYDIITSTNTRGVCVFCDEDILP